MLPRINPTFKVHFYIDSNVEAESVKTWDPDVEPWRFASGIGHNLYELFIRARRSGVHATAGSDIPKDTHLVVAFISSLVNTESARKILHFRTIMIRSDADQMFDAPFKVDVAVVPNEDAYWRGRYGARAVALPALPQRGLIPREGSRHRLDTVTLKCNPGHVPPELLEPDFQAHIGKQGFRLDVDMPTKVNGSDQSWHDFSKADLTLCIRGHATEDSLIRKPPTKLINAWNALSVPIITPEPGYLGIGTPDVDCFLVTGAHDLPSLLRRIRTDQNLYTTVLANVEAKSEEYSERRILSLWMELFEHAAGRKTKLQILRAQLELTQTVLRGRLRRISTSLKRRLTIHP